MRSLSFATSQLLPERQAPDIQTVTAVQHVRRMRGGSQSHLLRCSDGKLYVVKFLNNPQHPRVLANEILAAGLAEILRLPFARTALVRVDDLLIQNTPALTLNLPERTVPCRAGLQFGSEYAINPIEGRIFDDFPTKLLDRVRNLADFAGVLAFDKWTGNVDNRQVVFWRKGREKKYSATFVDQGHCFNAGQWTFPDRTLRGCYRKNEVYSGVRGWQSFEPWLSRIEHMDNLRVRMLGSLIPTEWALGTSEISCLLETLSNRRFIVRDLIHAFRFSCVKPFPNWS